MSANTTAPVQTTVTDVNPNGGEPHSDWPNLVDIRPHSEGTEWLLTECPLCSTTLADHDSVAAHVASHDPADFGLSPLWGDSE